MDIYWPLLKNILTPSTIRSITTILTTTTSKKTMTTNTKEPKDN